MSIALGWHDIHWGDAPGWVGAVGTAGALLLGFYILLRDRRMEERRQAMQFASAWSVDTPEPSPAGSPMALPEFKFRLDLFNASSSIIVEPNLRVLRKRGTGRRTMQLVDIRSLGESKAYAEEPGVETVSPGQRDKIRTATIGGYYGEYIFELRFEDAAGRSWKRDIMRNRLRRERG